MISAQCWASASAAEVWHLLPLEGEVWGNLSGNWSPWWKPWLGGARSIADWEELPGLSGLRPCLLFSRPVGVAVGSCQAQWKSTWAFPRKWPWCLKPFPAWAASSCWPRGSLMLWSCAEVKIAQVKRRCVAGLAGRWFALLCFQFPFKRMNYLSSFLPYIYLCLEDAEIQIK